MSMACHHSGVVREMWLYMYMVVWTVLGGYTHGYTGIQPYRPHRDYCAAEFIQACQPGEALVISDAKYGRITPGDCEIRDEDIGCFSDVTATLSRRCTGRQRCDVDNIATLFGNIRPCGNDRFIYLQATHSCLPVVQGSTSMCHSPGFLQVMSKQGYLSSASTAHEYGTSSCPWVIEGTLGQRVTLTLQGLLGSNRGDQHQYCQGVATVLDGDLEVPLSTCDTQDGGVLYTSRTHRIRVMFDRPRRLGVEDLHPVYHVVGYQVIGCPLPRLPARSYVTYQESFVIVHCNDTDESWHLVCREDGTLSGDVGSCSGGGALGSTTDSIQQIPVGVTVFLILGIALIICVLILAVGLYHIKKRTLEAEIQKSNPDLYSTYPPPPYYRQQQHQHVLLNQMDPHKQQQDPSGAGGGFATLDRNRPYTAMQTGPPRRVVTQQDGIYQHIWEVKPAQQHHPQPHASPLPPPHSLGALPDPPVHQSPLADHRSINDFQTLELDGRHAGGCEGGEGDGEGVVMCGQGGAPIPGPSLPGTPLVMPHGGSGDGVHSGSAESDRQPPAFHTFRPQKQKKPKATQPQLNTQQSAQQPRDHHHHQLSNHQPAPPQWQPAIGQSLDQSEPNSATPLVNQEALPFYYELDPHHVGTISRDGANTMGTGTIPRPVVSSADHTATTSSAAGSNNG